MALATSSALPASAAQPHEAGDAFGHGDDHAASATGAHRVQFPVAQTSAGVHHRRTLLDRLAVGEAPGPALAVATPSLGQPQPMTQAMAVDVAIDAGPADHRLAQQPATAMDLFRTQALFQTRGDLHGHRVGDLWMTVGLRPSLGGDPLCLHGAIGLGATIAAPLARDGAGMALEVAGDIGHRKPCRQLGGNLVAFVLGQVLVRHVQLHLVV